MPFHKSVAAVLVAAALAAGIGFVLHVGTLEVLDPYIAAEMAGHRIVAVQDGSVWLTWLVMGLIVALCLDRAMPVQE
jgi:hypothetical protein